MHAVSSSLWFVFHHNTLLLLLDNDGKPVLPSGPEPPLPSLRPRHHLGLFQGCSCVAYALDAKPEGNAHIFVTLPKAWGLIGKDLYDMAGRAYQMLHWDRCSRFCPVCGTRTNKATDVSKHCPACGYEIFPPIAVAVLVLVRKEDSVLLARAHNFEGAFFGLVAGFLEPGETLEDCVAREVAEETGLFVENIRYFGCQAWPYPSGLMVGFVADYAKGVLAVEHNELLTADFFPRQNLPDLPHRFSLARQMIDWWIENGKEPPFVGARASHAE